MGGFFIAVCYIVVFDCPSLICGSQTVYSIPQLYNIYRTIFVIFYNYTDIIIIRIILYYYNYTNIVEKLLRQIQLPLHVLICINICSMHAIGDIV